MAATPERPQKAAQSEAGLTGREPLLSSVGRPVSTTGLEPTLSGSQAEPVEQLRQIREVLAARHTDARILRQVAEVLVGLLGETRYPYRDEIRRLLASLKPEVVLVAVSKRAEDADALVREQVACVLGERPVSRRTVPAALQRLLCDPVLEVRRAAVSSLCQFHLQAWQPLSTVLASLLRGGDRAIRETVLSQVRRLPPQPAVIAAVTELLADPHFRVRWLVLQVLTEAGPLGSGAVPALVQLLRSPTEPDPVLRMSAAETLAGLGIRARPALPELLRLLADPATPAMLRWAVAQAVGSVGSVRDQSAIHPVLDRCLGEADRQTRRCALESIRRLGSAARGFGDRLRSLLTDADECVRIDAARALAAVEPSLADSHCRPLLLELSARQDRFLRKAAREALTELRLNGTLVAKPLRPLRSAREDDSNAAEAD